MKIGNFAIARWKSLFTTTKRLLRDEFTFFSPIRNILFFCQNRTKFLFVSSRNIINDFVSKVIVSAGASLPLFSYIIFHCESREMYVDGCRNDNLQNCLLPERDILHIRLFGRSLGVGNDDYCVVMH